MRGSMNSRSGWISNPARPSYGNQAETELLDENFWGAGQQQLFVKGLRKRGFRNHELNYIKSKKGQPKDGSIIDKVLYKRIHHIR